MKRMFFKNQGRRKREDMELDITSLLDVLVILLVFLLKSYNASDLKLDLVKNLTIPKSESIKLGNHAVIVQVDSDKKLYVNKEELGIIRGNGESKALLEALNTIRKNARTPAAKKDKSINLVFDKKIPYKVMKSVMHTSAIAGYTQFKFIVQGSY